MTQSRTDSGRPGPLRELARLGFAGLTSAAAGIQALGVSGILPAFAHAADPDQALALLQRLLQRAPEPTRRLLAEDDTAQRLIRVLGASSGLGDFLLRRPEEILPSLGAASVPRDAATYRASLVEAVQGLTGEAAWVALRVRYRRELTRLAAWDLAQPSGTAALSEVAAALADLAGAALDAALDVARREVPYPAEEVDWVQLAIIGMGKTGGHELNYLSDVDVIFVGGLREPAGAAEAAESVDAADADAPPITEHRAVEIATRLAMLTMRGISELAVEPGLWEVDANLRPEGKDGALVRTLESHLVYYERWAHSWEFQALLKARAIAGDLELGRRYEAAVAPLVWASAQRDGFVESVQRMRERVTHHIPAEQVDVQLKLGPGGLRDIEFTAQLLQLVHGLADARVRVRGTLPALEALAEQGYVGRTEAADFAEEYRFLRLLEHRLQLRQLRRTHLMSRDVDELRVLARATGLASTAEELRERWQGVKARVRSLHERLFFRPLLGAVAALPDGADDFRLTSEQAIARLAAIGFRDPRGALAHIAALTDGVSRRARIQRNLLPVMIQWFSQGADPDMGLLTFRRISESIGDQHWYGRMLRDSAGVAQRLTEVLSGSRYVAQLFERIPEAAAWLEDDDDLRPRPLTTLLEEQEAITQRYAGDPEAAMRALLHARRREMLRLAMSAMLGVLTIDELGPGISDVATTLLAGALRVAHGPGDGIEIGIIAMGRFGGAELGFSSDADVMYVYRDAGAGDEGAATAASIVHAIARLTEDIVVPFDIDLALRPEGRNGAVVRSLESYRAYYERWSLTWEAQALLRARVLVGDPGLLADFDELIGAVRYHADMDTQQIREVKRIKARVEAERLPQGADPARHLKLGRGSLSDVEWLVQLLQLQHAREVPELRTTSTLGALAAAVSAGFIDEPDAALLREAWLLASNVRSAVTLWSAKAGDLLPTDRGALEGIARLMGYPPGSATALEEDYLRVTRRARRVFERRFFDTH